MFGIIKLLHQRQFPSRKFIKKALAWCLYWVYNRCIQMKRDVKKKDSKLITVWVPKELLPPLAQGVLKTDSDRSKFVRNAIREKLARHGVSMEAAV